MYCITISILLCLNCYYLAFFSLELRETKIVNKKSDFRDFDNFGLKNSGSWDLTGTPIFIDDADPNYNWSKTAKDNDWCFGNGTWNHPYIIENVTLNGQNLDNCIEIRNSNNHYFKIRNCTLFNSYDDPDYGGIKFYDVSKGLIVNNTCYDHAIGIYLESCNNNTISKNRIQFNTRNLGDGIRIYGGNNNTIIENNIHNNRNALWLDGASGACQFNNISRNTVFNNNGGMEIVNDCENNFILDNQISDGYIDLYRSHYNLISGNTINKIENPAIWLSESDNNIILNNTIRDCNGGIRLHGFNDNNNISKNILKDILDAGIRLFSYDGMEKNYNNKISGNIMYGCGIIVDSSPDEAISTTIDTLNLVNGKPVYFYVNEANLMSENFLNPGQIILIDCKDSFVSDYTIFSVRGGISLGYCVKVTLSNNVLSNNSYYGIRIAFCNETVISSNNVYNNGNGIIIFRSDFTTILENNVTYCSNEIRIYSTSSRNLIYKNILIGNDINAIDYGSDNNWDNGIIGNFWDDYIGYDLNSDGIGDIPYNISGSAGSQDHFPIFNVRDEISPIITIHLPISNQVFGVKAPEFNITVNDLFPIDATWYTIDGGITNYTFSGSIGSIDQNAWENAAEGEI